MLVAAAFMNDFTTSIRKRGYTAFQWCLARLACNYALPPFGLEAELSAVSVPESTPPT